MSESTTQPGRTERITDIDRELELKKRLALISLIDEGTRTGSSDFPVMADLFNNLWDLVNSTVSGSKINRLKPEESSNGFQVVEIASESGETLGRLNMLYLKKPIPCYYLVYVEVAPPFRRKGLGTRILEYFREFLDEKSALGILDNIIPEDDPTYSIYSKQGWEPAEFFIGESMLEPHDNYMIYTPLKFRKTDIHMPVLKLIYHLKRRRHAIDMRDNEVMVQRTIKEFKDIYSALMTYFDSFRGSENDSDQLMRFMFTRFVTKFIAFRRRIGELIGYTGGDSLEQLSLAPHIEAIEARTYAPPGLSINPSLAFGDRALFLSLPEKLKQDPAGTIDALPNYARPSLVSWLNEKALKQDHHLTLGNLMELGFDPTRLKEITLAGKPYIFERIQARQVETIKSRKALLERIEPLTKGLRSKGANIKINPPLLAIRDRGNAYILRRKVKGIHWDEAVEQLQCSPVLKDRFSSLKLDRLILATLREACENINKHLKRDEQAVVDAMAFFVSWDLASNLPKLMIDFAATSFESVWMA